MMSIHKKLNTITLNRDTDFYEELLREDCVFIFHRSVNEFGKKWFLIVEEIMSNEMLVNALNRCLYGKG